jgi:hypothetical protein
VDLEARLFPLYQKNLKFPLYQKNLKFHPCLNCLKSLTFLKSRLIRLIQKFQKFRLILNYLKSLKFRLNLKSRWYLWSQKNLMYP